MQTSESDANQLWDKDLLLERIMNNHEIFMALLNVFIEDIPKLSIKLDSAISNKNYEEIKTLAHNLKGSAYNMTADSLGDIAKDIELACKERKMDLIHLAQSKLERQLPLTVAAFKEELTKHS